VLSIGCFLGMGTHMVVVRYDSLKFEVDVQKVAAGYRASKVIGNSVLNVDGSALGIGDAVNVLEDGEK
jgi:hypothetical protein